MKKRIFWKFLAGFIAMGLLLGVSFYFAAVGEAKSLYLQLQQDKLRTLGDVLQAELTELWPQAEPPSLQRWILEKARQAQTRLTLIDPRGVVLADSEEDPAQMQNHSDRPEIAAALAGHPRTEFRFSYTLRQNMMYFALPLKQAGKTVAVLRLSLFAWNLDRVFSSWRWKVTVLFLGLLLASLILSLWLSRNLTRPIRDLARAARNFSSGSPDSHVRFRRRDELGQLAVDFNAMVDGQKDMVDRIRYGQQELETILSSISDGLLVIDARDRIVRAGPRFRQLAGEAEPIGKPYWEVLRLNAFAELVKNSQEGKAVHAELEIQQRLFLASLSPLPDDGGTVVTLHDLSETRLLERQKKDFVANVSHELRTPLTAIKGYAETLAEEAAGESRKYLEVILRHADRLIELTNDLLGLSELEERSVRLNREAIDWPALLGGIRALFEKKISDKKLTLEFSLPQDLAEISFHGDRFRLEQMFINLLDNAVKYTDQGGIVIRISSETAPEDPRRGGPEGPHQGNLLRIDIQDSGVGMAAEHLPRIFERFYVVDKARSRQSGGTGLGLAIVKHIVGLHGGWIEVRSSPGTGCTFTIRLPFID
jgi:two-component system phosphate regulon sensor histidine kinase PhoR